MNCEECPFKGQDQIDGEGSRILREYTREVKMPSGSILNQTVTERDSEGQYDVVCVGMAPAREELQQGRVFVGVSGQMLRKTLDQMEIKDYYLCNVFLCPIIDDDWVKDAMGCCRNVKEEILARKPKLVIALGDLPLKLLCTDEFKDYGIKSVEGRVLPSNIGIPLLPITHPAYYWRNPNEAFDFLECMRSGIKFLRGEYQQAEEPTHTVVTYENYTETLNELDKYGEVACDTETTGLHPYGYEPSTLLEMGLSGNSIHAYVIPAPLIPEFKPILEEKKIIFWNAPFDAAFCKQIGITPNVWFDGLLAHYSMDERAYSHGLKRVARIYLGCEDWEKDIHNYLPARKKDITSYAVIPTEIRYEYLTKDVTRTFQLKDALWNDINWKVFDRLLMPACRMLIEIQHRGMRIDPYKLLDMDRVITEDLNKLDKELQTLTGDILFNPNSPKQVSELVYDKMKLPIDHHFGRSSSKLALDPYRDIPVINKILDYRQLSKTKGTYLEGFAPFVDRDFRIHPNINLFKTVTGRLSSDDPSIMNIKTDSKLKSMFLPDEGSIMGYADIKQNELRWYFIYSGDEEIEGILRRTPTLENPRANDPHYIASSIAYGEELADKMRGPAKAVVFGRLYKRSENSIRYQVGNEVLRKLVDTIDGMFPGIKGYNRDIMKEIRSKGYLESYFGRRRRFILLTPDNIHNVEYQGVNFPIQSAGSDLMLLNMLNLWEKKDQLGIWPFWPVHDSITWNMKDKNILPLIKKELESYSLEVVNGIIPFEWDCKWGPDWAFIPSEED